MAFRLQATARVVDGSAFYGSRYVETHLKTSTRVIIFLGLIAVYVGLVNLTGVKLLIFTGRYHGLGIDVFILADYAACFWSGPFIGPMDPYPYRSTCAFIGGLGMVAVSFFKFVILR